MKIPIKIPGHKKDLVIERRFTSKDIIIPLGCDCHPAYMLNRLHIRDKSLPFDWLNTDPLEGIEYVTDNLVNHFKHFLTDLYTNERGYIVAKQYKFTEFMHEHDLMENEDSKNKLLRRVDRFITIIENQRNIFLYNITSKSINSSDDVTYFINAVNKFLTHIKNNDSLHIYIRYDENFDENKTYCDELCDELNKIAGIKCVKYIRFKEKFGIWGDERKYERLMRNLAIKIKPKLFPKIYIE
jgi:hypothetical protein